MGRGHVTLEIGSIALGGILGFAFYTAMTPGCGPPPGTTIIPALVSAPQATTLRFTVVEPSGGVILEGVSDSAQTPINSGSVVHFPGTDFDGKSWSPDHRGRITLVFDVLHDDTPVSRASVTARRARISLRAGWLRVEDWSPRATPASPLAWLLRPINALVRVTASIVSV